MLITRQRFIDINKFPLIAAIVVYILCVFVTKSLQIGLLFVFGAGFFNLLHQQFFQGRPKLAAHIWLIPAAMALITYPILLEKEPHGSKPFYLAIVLAISLVPFFLLFTGKPEGSPSKRQRIKIVSARILVQVLVFTLYVTVFAVTWIKGTKTELFFWGMFHVLTVAIFPFLFGRVLCAWLCPNATFQDALLKNLSYRRPISRLPRAIEEQSHSTAMSISGKADKTAPYLPFTLLLSWFPMFFLETTFDLTVKHWYPMAFMYGLFILSLFLPWRKMCTHFCWLSSYRCLAGQNSLWRVRFNRSKCRDCKVCLAEKACPFYIDIRNQDNEMPATCCLCFSCMDACPHEGVITFRRARDEKQRLRAQTL